MSEALKFVKPPEHFGTLYPKRTAGAALVDILTGRGVAKSYTRGLDGKPKTVQVHAIAHRAPDKYRGATLFRAAQITDALIAAGIVRLADYLRVRNAIHDGIAGGRTAGFAAGCAWGRSR
jgi:hypothetical protein